MFDKLDDLVEKLNEILKELSDPSVVNDQARYRKLMKEQSDIAPIVEKYNEYKQAKQDVADSLEIIDLESDEEMKEMAKEELADAKKRVEACEQELKILLLPKDPNDDKNVVVEIRAGAGGDEAALFAAELFRMYQHYAESNRWKIEVIDSNESGIDGLKEIIFEGAEWFENQISDNRTIYYLKFPVQKWGKVKQTSRNRAFFVEIVYPLARTSVLK